MSTIYTFHEECAALSAAAAPTDELLIYDASAATTKNIQAKYLAMPGGFTAGTTAFSISTYGAHSVTSTASAYELSAAPFAGAIVVITQTTTTTGGITINSSNTCDIDSAGNDILTFNGRGDAVTLLGISTAAYNIISNVGSVAASGA